MFHVSQLGSGRNTRSPTLRSPVTSRPPESPPGDDPLLDRAIADRLTCARWVAAAKAASGAPVHDPVREVEVLADALALGERVGADLDFLEAVIGDQLVANRDAQVRLLALWADAPPAPAVDLAGLRRLLSGATCRIVEGVAGSGSVAVANEQLRQTVFAATPSELPLADREAITAVATASLAVAAAARPPRRA